MVEGPSSCLAIHAWRRVVTPDVLNTPSNIDTSNVFRLGLLRTNLRQDTTTVLRNLPSWLVLFEYDSNRGCGEGNRGRGIFAWTSYF